LSDKALVFLTSQKTKALSLARKLPTGSGQKEALSFARRVKIRIWRLVSDKKAIEKKRAFSKKALVFDRLATLTVHNRKRTRRTAV